MTDRVIVFDGVCVLCSAWVGFVLKRDRRREFRFAAMQSATGRALLIQSGVDPDDPSTFLVIDGESVFSDSDALIRVLRQFGIGWRATASMIAICPRSWRNACYRFIARHRYRLFGRREVCYLPLPTDAERFLK